MPSAVDRAFSVVSPGTYGLNTQSSIDLMDPRFALQNLNSVQDNLGRMGCRKGDVQITTTPLAGTPDIQQMHEYVKIDGTTQILSAANNNIYTGTTALTSVYSAGLLANNWQFTNFNNYAWAF